MLSFSIADFAAPDICSNVQHFLAGTIHHVKLLLVGSKPSGVF
jgi:hypothetical protein